MGDDIKRVDMNDRLSELPEEIIINILSRLNTEEAARTSVLSKQWRYYWTNVHSLNFMKSNPYRGRLVLDKFVTNVFCRRQPLRLSKLTIWFNGKCSNRDAVDKVISLVYNYAISHQIEELVTDDIGSFQFPTLKTLRWRHNGVLSDLHGFTSLTVLELDRVTLDDSIRDDVFSNCLNLEKLVMDRCSSVPAMLCISNPRLISLQIKHSFYSGYRVVIKSPKLELCELDYIDHPANLRIDDCPALDNVNIHICFVVGPFRQLKPEFVNPGFSTLCDVKSQGVGGGFSAHCDVKMFYCDFVSASEFVKICKGLSYARSLTMWLSSAGGTGSRILYKHDATASSEVTAHLFAETLSAPDVQNRWGSCIFRLFDL